MDEYIGSRVREERLRRGLTTVDLAKKAGLSQAQISRLENGAHGFRSGTLVRIAKALRVKPTCFFLDDARALHQGDVSSVRSGSALPDEVKEALQSEKFKRFILKAARVFMEDDQAFNEIGRLVRKTKLR